MYRPLFLVFTAAIWVTVGASAAEAPSDYLSDNLRSRVETLKVNASNTPTDLVNIKPRLATLWDWLNAYALSGGYVPVNATQSISQMSAYPLTATNNRFAEFDRMIREFTLRDENPRAFGTLVANLGPFEARSFVTIEQSFTVGTKAVEAGGGFLIGRHFMPNHGRLQATEPTAANFISIRSSNPRVEFTHGTFPLSGMHGGFRNARQTLVFRIASGRLSSGDIVTLTYGDTSGGSTGFLMSDVSSDRMPLPVYLDFDGSKNFMSLPIQPVVVTGTSVAGVHAFAPSVVAINEPFDISVRAEDRFYNRATGPLPSWQVSLNGNLLSEIPASSKAIHMIRDVRLDAAGVYRISVRSADGSITGIGNPILVEREPKRRIYWGDTHGHSGFAEGVGTPERFMTWARDDARLDYVTHSEHDIWLDDFEWEVLRENVEKYSVNNEFIAFLGYEWTIRNTQGGHHNVLFRNTQGRRRVPAQTHGTLSKLYQGLRTQHDPADVVVIPHAHQAGDYRLNDPLLEPLIEVMSQHGTFEWFGRMYLKQGHQVGFTAASDNHLSQPGYTAPRGRGLSQRGGLGALRAARKSRDNLFDAMKDLASYATTGDRMILDVSVNGVEMGQRARFSLERKLRGRIVGTAPIDTVTIFRNDEAIWKQDYLQDDAKRVSSSGTFHVTFQSDSEPTNRGDNPRGWRLWQGTLRLTGATLKEVSGTDFHNIDSQSLKVLDDQTLAFSTLTRGDTSSIVLDLENIRRTGHIDIDLAAAREFGGAPPIFRPPQNIPASSVTLAFSAMKDGRVTTSLVQDDYVDTVSLRSVVTDGPDDVQFEFDDLGDGHGDYYYVRVLQANDAMAWSSPIWVGGYPKR